MLTGVRVTKCFENNTYWAGTIVEDTERYVTVDWDDGVENRLVKDDKTLRKIYVFDNATSGVHHVASECKECHAEPILGICWQFKECNEYLCSRCYHEGKRFRNHNFERIDFPGAERTEVGNRVESNKIIIYGKFPGAVVVQREDNDNAAGMIISGKNPLHEVEVFWNERDEPEKVDIKLKEKGKFHMYVEHLPQLSTFCGLRKQTSTSTGLQVGNRVSICLDEETLSCIFEGEELEKAKQLREGIGKVSTIKEKDEVVVSCNGKDRLTCCANILCKFPSPGDRVQVMDDIETVKRLQEGHGGWYDKLLKVLGKVCQVHCIDEDGDATVALESDGSQFLLNPDVLERPSKPTVPVNANLNSCNCNQSFGCFCSVQPTTSRGIPQEPVLGPSVGQGQKNPHRSNKETTREREHANPTLPPYAREGLSDLHCAVLERNERDVKNLIQAQPDLVKQQLKANGNTILHLAALNSDLNMMRILLEDKRIQNLDIVNKRNDLDQTPVHFAANQGQEEMLRLLVRCGADVKCSDSNGDTALTLLTKQQAVPLPGPSHRDVEERNSQVKCDFCTAEDIINIFLNPCGHRFCFGCSQEIIESKKFKQCCKCKSYIKKVISSVAAPVR